MSFGENCIRKKKSYPLYSPFIVKGRAKGQNRAINLHLYHYAGNNPVRYTDPDGRQTAVPLPTGESLVGMTAEEMGACFDELLADCGPAAFFIFVGLFIFSLNGDSVATQRNQDDQKEETNDVSSSIKQGAQAAAPSPAPNFDPEDNNDDDHKDKFKETLDHIKKNNKAPDGFKGGREYHNNEGKLPSVDKNGNKITYKEWDVNPQQKGANRGAERLVTGSDGSAYKTVDHYKTFIQME